MGTPTRDRRFYVRPYKFHYRDLVLAILVSASDSAGEAEQMTEKKLEISREGLERFLLSVRERDKYKVMRVFDLGVGPYSAKLESAIEVLSEGKRQKISFGELPRPHLVTIDAKSVKYYYENVEPALSDSDKEEIRQIGEELLRAISQ